MHRAYALLTLKDFDQGRRTFAGIATSPIPDRVGDRIEAKGIHVKNPLPLLLYHDSKRPVGEARLGKSTEAGTPFDAVISEVNRPGVVKDRLDEAIDSLNANPPLIRGVSIGFRELVPPTYNKTTGGYDFSSIEVLELSMVVVPAHQDATIHTLKQFDTGLGAFATEPVVDVKSAGVPASPRVVKTVRTEHHMKKSYAEQIQTWEATRQAKAARMDAILDASAETGTTLDEAQQEEHDGLEVEVKGIDAQLVRLRAAEAREKAAAKPVSGRDPEEGSRSRNPSIQVMERQLPPGLRMARFVMAKAAVRAQQVEYASDYIKHFFPDDHQLIEYAKTAVAAGTTANAQAPLLQYTDIQTEFIEFLRPMTILGKFGQNGVPDVTRVPFNVRVGTQTAGGSASWVGEGKAKPLTKGTFGTITMDFTKLAAISVLTKEEVRFPSLSAQTKVRDDLTRAIAQQIDKDFIDPANLGSAGVKPAAITANIVATPATATTAVGLAVDLRSAINVMIAAGIQPTSLVAIMSQAQALSLSLMRTSLAVRNYPDITMNGGNLEGIPVITSEAITAVGSPATGMIVLVNARDVFLADDGNVTIATSDQASLEMSDAPAQDATTGGGASMVSMFQTNSLAILAEREINWKLVRAASVQYISSPAYVPQ